jgi:hypothetical protein
MVLFLCSDETEVFIDSDFLLCCDFLHELPRGGRALLFSFNCTLKISPALLDDDGLVRLVNIRSVILLKVKIYILSGLLQYIHEYVFCVDDKILVSPPRHFRFWSLRTPDFLS